MYFLSSYSFTIISVEVVTFHKVIEFFGHQNLLWSLCLKVSVLVGPVLPFRILNICKGFEINSGWELRRVVGRSAL